MLEAQRTLEYKFIMKWWRSNARLVCLLRVGLILAAALAVVAPAWAQSSDGQSGSKDQSASSDKSSNSDKQDKNDKDDKNSEPPTTRLRIEVTGPNGKPVGSASVYIRFPQTVGILHKEKLAELNLKTNEDGTIKVPEIPQGKILVQVVAKGLHTYGKWYDIDKPQETLQIKLEAPPRWY